MVPALSPPRTVERSILPMWAELGASYNLQHTFRVFLAVLGWSARSMQTTLVLLLLYVTVALVHQCGNLATQFLRVLHQVDYQSQILPTITMFLLMMLTQKQQPDMRPLSLTIGDVLCPFNLSMPRMVAQHIPFRQLHGTKTLSMARLHFRS